VIVQWLMTIGSGFVSWLATLFPAVPMPSWLTASTGSVYSFMASASNIGVWVPWGALSVAVSFLIIVYGGALAFRLVLKLVSFLPFVGGNG
jgi:hypothetical protein